ncbi:MAG: peptidoglycan DD-metalloendopeptidase family protein [Aureispira sp.]
MKSIPISRLLTQLKTTSTVVEVLNYSISDYLAIDLSTSAPDLEHLDLTDAAAMEKYIELYCQEQGAKVAYGGYLEHRNLYKHSTHFNQQEVSTARNIHLGIDLWVAAGTAVIAPLRGTVHSFQDNKGLGNYGPTIILEHRIKGVMFYSLYGHLSRESLEGLAVGQIIENGQKFAVLGTAEVNGNYAPHLHFQLILDLEGKQGDYPGVCSQQDVAFYQQNCPNPTLLLSLD